MTSVQDLVGNYRLLSYALDAYGLGDQINSKLSSLRCWKGGSPTPKASPTRWRIALAGPSPRLSISPALGASSVTSASSVQTTTDNYVEQQLESDQGAQDVGVQLALYFQRVAPTVTSEYGILADPNLPGSRADHLWASRPRPARPISTLQAQTLSELMPIRTPGSRQSCSS